MTPTRKSVPSADHPQDTCECGDYRRDHAGGTGGCIFTPDPDHDRNDRDGHFGAGPCHKFKLAYRYPAPTEIAASSHDIRQAAMSDPPFSSLLPSGWHLTHLILLDPEWQANITDGEHVAVGTGETHEAAITQARNHAIANVYVGKLFHLPRTTVELSPTIPLLSALGLVERPIHRRKV